MVKEKVEKPKEKQNNPRRSAWVRFCRDRNNWTANSDTRLFMFAIFDVAYVWWISKLPFEKLIVSPLFWLTAGCLTVFPLVFTSLYRGWCLTNNMPIGSRRSGWPDATFWLFILFTAVLMIPPIAYRQNFILFQAVFPPVIGAIVGWGAYLDARLLYRGTTLSKHPGDLGAELSFVQMLISQIVSGYALAAVTVMLGVGSIDILFGLKEISSLNEALPFGAGVLLIIGQLHYMITLRLFVRYEELIQAGK